MLQSALDQPGRQGRNIERQREVKAQIRLDLLEMGRARMDAATIRRNGGWRHTSLLGHKGDGSVWGRTQVIGGKAQIPQRTELQRKAQLIGGTALPADFLGIAVG